MTYVDWFKVLNDLQHLSCTRPDVARLTGISASTVGRIYRRESEPRFDAGERILRLWCRATGKTTDDVPRAQFPNRN